MPVDSQGPSEQKPIKKFGEKGAWAYPGTAQGFKVAPISSGTRKVTNFKFYMHIHRIDRNKSPLKISVIVAVGVVRNTRKFSEHPYPYSFNAILCIIENTTVYRAKTYILRSKVAGQGVGA